MGYGFLQGTNPESDSYLFPNAYSFYKNGTVKYRPGFYKYDIEDSIRFRYKGSFSKFYVKSDSLYIFEPVSKKWSAFYLQSVSSKKLVLHSKELVIYYDRVNNKSDSKNDFDAVIVSNEPCFGTCHIDQTYISRSGDMWYNGFAFTSDNGLFHSCITRQEFSRFEKDFKMADYLKLDESYSAHATDMSAIDLTFIKDGKIVKHIHDYGNVSPTLLSVTAATLGDYHSLKTMDRVATHLKPIYFQRFINPEQQITLSTSQSFYLNVLLIGAKEVAIRNNLPFLLDDNPFKDVQSCKTDGRFFTLIYSNKTSKTFDIGHNFITENASLKWSD